MQRPTIRRSDVRSEDPENAQKVHIGKREALKVIDRDELRQLCFNKANNQLEHA
jgi:hypothetical protein